jgi:hypothetical protein
MTLFSRLVLIDILVTCGSHSSAGSGRGCAFGNGLLELSSEHAHVKGIYFTLSTPF